MPNRRNRMNSVSYTHLDVYKRQDHGYCYCAIHFTKDAMLLAYCAGGPEDGSCLAKTRIRRIPRSQLEEIR